MNRSRLAPLALVLLVIAALLSGCGSSADDAAGNHSSAASDTNTAAGSGNSDQASAHQKGVVFSACMRNHGVQNFPDPPASGNFTIDQIANGSSLDTNSPAFNSALQACRSLEPSGFTGTTRNSRQQSAALKFAECVRQHGVADFPDPTAGQPLIDTNNIPSANKPGGMAILNAAAATCRSDLNAAMLAQK